VTCILFMLDSRHYMEQTCDYLDIGGFGELCEILSYHKLQQSFTATTVH